MKFSFVPIVVISLFAFLLSITYRASQKPNFKANGLPLVYGLFVLLLCWLGLSSFLSYMGIYFSTIFLPFLPQLVGFTIAFLLVILPLILSASFRETVLDIIAKTPLIWLISIHALRITAIGSIFKYFNGELPGHLIIPTGFGDLLIGLSALYIAYCIAYQKTVSKNFLITWNILGICVFLVAGILLHVSVPGPFQVFYGQPSSREIFYFPLALVATFIGPIFVCLHLATLWKLLQIQASRE